MTTNTINAITRRFNAMTEADYDALMNKVSNNLPEDVFNKFWEIDEAYTDFDLPKGVGAELRKQLEALVKPYGLTAMDMWVWQEI